MGTLAFAASRAEIGARTESPSGARDHDRSIGFVGADLAEGGQQLIPHHAVDGVFLLRPIQGDRHHTGIAPDLKRLHGAEPTWLTPTAARGPARLRRAGQTRVAPLNP